MSRKPSSGMGFGQFLIYVAVISIVGILAFNYYKKNVADYTFIPKEMQLTYIPADFKFDMEDENVIAILRNPHRYHREFDELIYKFNLSLLYHIANRMDLADSIKVQLEPEYQKHHPYLQQLYFNDFINIRDTSANTYEAWYANEATGAVETMNEVASKYTCFLVNLVITTLLKTEGGILAAKGKKIDTPCGIAMTEGLRPLIARLKEKAAIEDFSRSKGMLENKVEKVIAELATMEVRDKKGLNKQLQTKIWGFEISSTDIEVSAISILKVGFKIDQYFGLELNSKNKIVTVTLPEPTILSHEVYPRVDKLDIGWMREVEKGDFNKNFNILRREFRRDALESDIMAKSKSQAIEIMNMIFNPILVSFDKKYRLVVKFKNLNQEDDSIKIINEAELNNGSDKAKDSEVPF
jgi:hypothetical protein